MTDEAPQLPDDYDKMPGGITGKGFMPGKSGNPGGRPKGGSITARIRRILERETSDGDALAEKVAEIVVARALRGDHKFLTTLLERIEGKVPDRITTEEDGSFTIILKKAGGDADD